MSFPTLVQRSTPKATGSTALTTMTSNNFGSSVTSGNPLITLVRTSGNTPGTPTDTVGTVYKLLGSAGTNPNLFIYGGPAGGSGTNATTVTLGSQTYWAFVTWEYGNAGQAPFGYFFSATGTGTTNCAMSGVTTTSADELLITFVSQSNFTHYTAGGGATLMDEFTDGTNFFGATAEYRVGSLSSYTASFTSSITNAYTVVGVSIMGGRRQKYGTWFRATNETLRVLSTDNGINHFDYFPAATYSPASSNNACRNPAPRYVNGVYYIMHSESSEFTAPAWNNSSHFAIASSTDGRVYTPFARPDFASVGSFNSDPTLWAGNWFDDPADGSEHFIFGASASGGGAAGTFQVWEIHPTTPGNYSTWSTPVAVTGSAIAANVTDPFIFTSGGTYYLFVQRHATNHDVMVMSSTSPFSGYNTLVNSGNWSGFSPTLTDGNDQPMIYVINGVTLMYSDYVHSTMYYTTQLTGDWKTGTSTWSAIAPFAALSPVVRAGALMDMPTSNVTTVRERPRGGSRPFPFTPVNATLLR